MPFLAVSVLGILFNPEGAGFLLFSLPVVAVSGAGVGAICGALAAAVVPISRKANAMGPALALGATVYFVTLTIVAAVLFLALVPADFRPWAIFIPLLTLIATGLATWGFAVDRRRITPAPNNWVPNPPSW